MQGFRVSLGPCSLRFGVGRGYPACAPDTVRCRTDPAIGVAYLCGMTKTKSRVIQGWRQVAARPGVAARRLALRPPRPGSVDPAPQADDRAAEPSPDHADDRPLGK